MKKAPYQSPLLEEFAASVEQGIAATTLTTIQVWDDEDGVVITM